MNKPLLVNKQNWERRVLGSDQPVAVNFCATWCGPCTMFRPTVNALAEQYADQLTVTYLDVDKNREIAQRYGVRSIPTMLLFSNGVQVDEIVGAQPKPQVISKVESFLQK